MHTTRRVFDECHNPFAEYGQPKGEVSDVRWKMQGQVFYESRAGKGLQVKYIGDKGGATRRGCHAPDKVLVDLDVPAHLPCCNIIRLAILAVLYVLLRNLDKKFMEA